MRLLIISILLLASLSFCQTGTEANKKAQTKEELQKLFVELNEAFEKRDRIALEKIYADEFVWVHASGSVDDRAAHIDDAFSIGVQTPMQVPNFDELYVYGETAILKEKFTPGETRNSFYKTSIFVKRDGRWQIVHLHGTQIQG